MVVSKEVDIGGFRFTLAQLPGMRGVKLFARLSRAIGPALARLAGGGSSLGELEVSNLAAAAESLFASLSDSELEGILRELFATSTVGFVEANGSQRVAPVMTAFDTIFAGRLQLLIEVVKAAIEVNFGDFLGDLGARLRGAGATIPSASK